MKLRRYQERAIAELREYVAKGVRIIVLVLPTGGGKTVIASSLIIDDLAEGKRALFSAHRRELVRQPFVKLIRYGVPPQDVGVIMARVKLPSGSLELGFDVAAATDRKVWRHLARRRPPARVQIASIESLRTRTLPEADLVIIDEGHRALAKGYRRVIDHYLERNPRVTIVLLTATPERGDGRGLAELGDVGLVTVATYRELVEEGFLVAPRGYSTPRPPDVSKVRVVGGDYDQDELAAVVNEDGLIGDIVQHYLERARGIPALCFAASVVHSRNIVERFLAAGVRAAHVDGETPSDERDKIFEQLADGGLDVVSNCDVATEGTDIPCVKCVIMARPTKSLRVMLQQAGRGSRPHGDKPFVILDHAGNLNEHGMPQRDREWSIEGRKKRPGGGGPLCWTCKECFAVNDLAVGVCAECGASRPVPERKELKEHGGQLVEVRELTDAELRVEWNILCEEWREKNATRGRPYKPGWVLFRFKEKFKRVPPPGCSPPAWTDDERERRERADALELKATAKGYDPRWVHVKLGRAMPTPPATTTTEQVEPPAFLPPVTTRWA